MFVTFEWKVGNDEFGHMLSDILKQNGVDNSGLLFDEHARTALAFHSLKSDDGKPEFMFYRNPSADILFRPEEIDKSLVKKVIAIFCIKSICKIRSQSRFNNSRVYFNSFCLGKLDSRTRTSLPKIKIK